MSAMEPPALPSGWYYKTTEMATPDPAEVLADLQTPLVLERGGPSLYAWVGRALGEDLSVESIRTYLDAMRASRLEHPWQEVASGKNSLIYYSEVATELHCCICSAKWGTWCFHITDEPIDFSSLDTWVCSGACYYAQLKKEGTLAEYREDYVAEGGDPSDKPAFTEWLEGLLESDLEGNACEI